MFGAVADLIDAPPEQLTLGEADLTRDVPNRPAMPGELQKPTDQRIGRAAHAAALDQDRGELGHRPFRTD